MSHFYFAQDFYACKEKEFYLLESIIFHFIFVLFMIWAFVWWLIVKKRLDLLRLALLPVVMLTQIQFPRDRSLVVRSLKCLEVELEKVFMRPVQIGFQFSQFTSGSRKNFLKSLCYLIIENKSDSDEKFLLNEISYSAAELISYFINKNKVKRVLFHYDYEKDIWKVCDVDSTRSAYYPAGSPSKGE